jgi:nicotinamidase-related amidase
MNTPTASVLVVVDLQQGFMTEHSRPVVPRVSRLLEEWHRSGRPSIITQFVNSPESPCVQLIGWTDLMPGDPGAELVPEIARHVPRARAVVQKDGYTSLTPEVVQLIKDHHWTDLYITGLDTDSCVLATALSAFEAGLTPWVVTDACASHAGPEVHEAALLVMSRFLGPRQLVATSGITVLPGEEELDAEGTPPGD